MDGRRAVAAGVLVAAVTTCACGAGDTSPPSSRAASPAAAALGFYQSTWHSRLGHTLRFACLQERDGKSRIAFASSLMTYPTATVEGTGAPTYYVALGSLEEPSAAGMYAVVRDGAGYCVSAIDR